MKGIQITKEMLTVTQFIRSKCYCVTRERQREREKTGGQREKQKERVAIVAVQTNINRATICRGGVAVYCKTRASLLCSLKHSITVGDPKVAS